MCYYLNINNLYECELKLNDDQSYLIFLDFLAVREVLGNLVSLFDVSNKDLFVIKDKKDTKRILKRLHDYNLLSMEYDMEKYNVDNFRVCLLKCENNYRCVCYICRSIYKKWDQMTKYYRSTEWAILSKIDGEKRL